MVESYGRQNNIKVFPGGIDYYLQKRIEQKEESEQETESENKLNRKDQKRIEAEHRQKKYSQTKDIKKELEICETEIHKMEEHKTNIEHELSSSQIFSNPSLAKEKNIEYDIIKTKLENLYDRWTQLSHKLEEIEKSFS